MSRHDGRNERQSKPRAAFHPSATFGMSASGQGCVTVPRAGRTFGAGTKRQILSPSLFAIPTLVLIFATPLAAAAEPTQSVSNAALANAGRQATLKMIDYGGKYCDGAAAVEAWLKALLGTEARSITWSGGKCVLVNDMRPGIDASSWPYCAQATITLVHPKDRGDSPLIEIYLEKPIHGRPGAAYAFRSLMVTRDDGPDYGRFRKDFEAQWDERFPPGSGAHRCKDE